MAEKKKPQNGKAKKPSEEKGQETGHALTIEWRIPDGMPGRYANQAMIQFGPTECSLLFFEVVPPALFGTREEKLEQAKKIKTVSADCVARIIFAHEFLPRLVKMLTETLSQHTAKPEQQGSDVGQKDDNKPEGD